MWEKKKRDWHPAEVWCNWCFSKELPAAVWVAGWKVTAVRDAWGRHVTGPGAQWWWIMSCKGRMEIEPKASRCPPFWSWSLYEVISSNWVTLIFLLSIPIGEKLYTSWMGIFPYIEVGVFCCFISWLKYWLVFMYLLYFYDQRCTERVDYFSQNWISYFLELFIIVSDGCQVFLMSGWPTAGHSQGLKIFALFE